MNILKLKVVVQTIILTILSGKLSRDNMKFGLPIDCGDKFRMLIGVSHLYIHKSYIVEYMTISQFVVLIHKYLDSNTY